MENSFKFIKDTFLQLTSKTYPYGSESGLVEEMIEKGIFPNLEKDAWGNYFYKVGDSRSIFASHLDTACREQVDVKHLINKNQIVTTDGTSILGADDKGGVTILLWMIKNNIPGLYYFFIGEEVGCIGSEDASTNGDFSQYDRIISFDKRGYTSVVSYQSSTRCCSDEFAQKISEQLNCKHHLFYKIDDNGGRTDSYRFISKIPECTNIAVGYANEHTTRESQDLYHLNKLALAVLGVDWENLPTLRDKSKIESKYDSYSSYSSRSVYRSSSIRSNYSWDNNNKSWSTKESTTEKTYPDDEYSYGWGNSKKKSYLENDDDEYSSNRYKKTRRGNKGNSYVDGVNGKLKLLENDNSGIFDTLSDKFLNSDLTARDLEMIRDQYLDMNLHYDRKDYERLINYL